MKKLTFVLLITTFLGIENITAQDIKFYVEKSTEISLSEFGFIYKTKHNTRRTGSYFGYGISEEKYKKIDLRVNGRRYTNKKVFVVDLKEVIKNKGKVFLSYKNPKFPETIHYDTLYYDFPENVEINQSSISTLNEKALSIKVYFNSGQTKHYYGKKLNNFLHQYGYSITSKEVSFVSKQIGNGTSSVSNRLPVSSSTNISSINLAIKASKNEDLLKDLLITISGNEYSSIHRLVVQYRGELYHNISGNDGNRKRSYGEDGDHGENISVMIDKFNDSLYTISIKSRYRNEEYLLNPNYSKVIIKSNGGNGSNGGSGDRGNDARNYRTAVDRESDRNLGQRGEDGYSGGNGGDGGDVSIYYPESFKPYLSVFNVSNFGGNGGQGGSGGKGGCHQVLEEQKGKVFDTLFPDRADYGRDGRNGRQGRSGKIDYILNK